MKKYRPMSFREYAKYRGVDVVGKIKMKWETYGMDSKQRVYIDEVGTKYYPHMDHPTIVLTSGKII